MTVMPTKPAAALRVLPLALLAALAWQVPAQAAGIAQAASPYRLQIEDPQAFRLRKEEGDEGYRLAPQYRAALAAEKAAAEPPNPNDPVVAALAAAARADMEAKPYARQIDRAARAAQLDPALVHALIYVESRHSAKAISSKGAVGLMQVLPDTGARYGIDPTRTPEQNLKAGTRYLRDLMARYDDRLDLVLAAYNAGEGAVQRYANRIPPYPETRDYVRAVLAKYAEWGGPRSATPLPAGGAIIATAAPAPLPPYGGRQIMLTGAGR